VGSAYTYVAVDRSGRRIRASGTAANEAALTRALQERGLVVLDVGPAAAEAAAPAGRPWGHSHKQDVLEVTRALAALLPAGLPLARALEAATHVASAPTAVVLAAVQARVEHGERLASALAEHPDHFSPLYVGLVRAGEQSGNLTGAFGRLAAQLDREEVLRAKLISVSVYPMVLAGAGGAAILTLMLLVVPRFVELLQGTGARLPSSTAVILDLSAALRAWWPLLAVLPVALAALMSWFRTTEEGRRAFATFLLRAPGLRNLRRQALGARVARLLATLLGGGAPLLGALDDTIECLDDPLARDELTRVRAQVREGTPLHAAIAQGGLFPPLLPKLVAIGEESGRLPEFLLKAGEMLEERTARAAERMVGLAEPVMILLFGGAVGFVALALLQAIYSVNAGSFR
jgi:type II secretory pathway component PulF